MSNFGSKPSQGVLLPVVPVVVVAAVLFAGGCAVQTHRSMPSNVPPFGQNDTLIYVPGISGYGDYDRDWLNGLKAGGYAGKTEVWDWTGTLGPIPALWAHGRQRDQSRRIAERVCRLRVDSPARRLVLVGHSAGAGLVSMALEDLPPDVKVDGIVLLAPALSRQYDLSLALRHVNGRADVFSSERDALVLAVGTFLLGTVDGVHGEAAGHGGFVKPQGASSDAYATIFSHPYSDDRRRHGDDGGHEGVLAPSMAADVIAPLLPGHEVEHEKLARTEPEQLR